MKKIILTAILAITLNAEMTNNCKKIRDKISHQVLVYNNLMETQEYPLAHIVVTRLIINMSWVEIECDKNNKDDKMLIDGIYQHFNSIYEEKQMLDKKYGVLKYEYKR